MTEAGAVYAFLSGFGIPAYASTSVPDDAAFPYLTYDLSTNDFWGGETSLVVSVWSRSEGEAEANRLAKLVTDGVGSGGRVLTHDGGGIWVKRGSPLVQSMGDPSDKLIRRRLVNLTCEFINE